MKTKYQKLYFTILFSKYVKSLHQKKSRCTLLTHFNKIFKVRYVGPKYNELWKHFLKCVDLVPNFTHFEKSFQSANFFQSALPHTAYQNL